MPSETGRIIPAQVGPHKDPAPAVIKGGILEHVTGGVLASQASAASNARHLGAGMKGGRKHRGGGTIGAINLPLLPTAGSIAGVSHAKVHEQGGNINAQMKALNANMSSALLKAPPVQLGGRKTYRKRSNGRGSSRHRRRRRTRRNHSSRRRRGILHKHH
jgi:hypothetical protein